MRNKRFQLDYKCSCLLMFLILYVNESIMFREMYSATFRGIATMVCLLFVCFYSALCGNNLVKCKLTMNKQLFAVFMLIICCMAMSIFWNGINLTFDLYELCLIVVALIIVCIMDREIFYRAFVQIMSFLALASVILFLGYHLLPIMFFEIFPNYLWHSGILVKNCYFAVLQVSAQNYRNFGIFYEPGHYAVFLVWALVIAMFKRTVNVKQVIILFIALITTLSTGGYISAIMLIATFIFLNSSISVRTKRRIGFYMMVLVGGVTIFFISNPSKLEFLLSKIFEASINTSFNSTDRGSGYERWRSAVYALEAFLEEPFLGIGQTGWQKKFHSIIGTATPLNWYGLRGFVYGTCMNYFYLKNARIEDENGQTQWALSLVLAVIMLWNIFSQNMAIDLFIFVFIFFQADGYRRNDQKRMGKHMRGLR